MATNELQIRTMKNNNFIQQNSLSEELKNSLSYLEATFEEAQTSRKKNLEAQEDLDSALARAAEFLNKKGSLLLIIENFEKDTAISDRIIEIKTASQLAQNKIDVESQSVDDIAWILDYSKHTNIIAKCNEALDALARGEIDLLASLEIDSQLLEDFVRQTAFLQKAKEEASLHLQDLNKNLNINF